ncbi:hypothetical protein Emed_002670 [Eimeria media]
MLGFERKAAATSAATATAATATAATARAAAAAATATAATEDIGSWYYNQDGTSTTTRSPPYEGDDGLYYPYGSRTSTTTGRPNALRAASYEEEEEGLYYPYGSRTSTTTGPPLSSRDYDEEEEEGLYYPYGSRTSTTTGPPYNPYGSGMHQGYNYYQQQGKGVYPYGDYTTTTTSYFCQGPHCNTSTTTVPPGSLAFEVASWLLEGGGHQHRHQREYEEDYEGYYYSTTTTTTIPPMAGRYPTKILTVAKPSDAARQKCRFIVTVAELTEGKRSVLKRGRTEVYVHPDDESISIKGVSEDQRAPATSFWSRFWRALKSAFTGGKERYRYVLPVPPHCGRLHEDPAAVAAEVREGDDVQAVMLRLSPEITAYYAPSTHPITFYFDVTKVGRNRFAQLRRCLYGAEITHKFVPGSWVFSSSQRIASVTATNTAGVSIALAALDIPCDCRPNNLGDISWWVMQSDRGNPIILLYFGYGEKLGHPVCLWHSIRQGRPQELDRPVDYEALGFWDDGSFN